MGLLDIVKAGVISGDKLNLVYNYAKSENFAIPAVNVNFLMVEQNLSRERTAQMAMF